MKSYPLIKDRFVPPVVGVDLEQSLNFVDSTGLDLEWFYTSFTYLKTFYKKGSRPFLEQIVAESVNSTAAPLERVKQCLHLTGNKVKHFSNLGFRGPPDRGLSEEDLIRSGQGWCNEQTRVFLALTQICGFPSRVVFASCVEGGQPCGHVTSEVFVDEKWVLVDQTADFIFVDGRGKTVNVLDFKRDVKLRVEVDEKYHQALMRDRQSAKDAAAWDSMVPYGKSTTPTNLFTNVGYCNYFIH